LSLQYSSESEPFTVGYAYEALARAEMVAGDQERMNAFLEQAKSKAEQLEDEEDKRLLVDDLATIG
jgi:hypothetical protein